MRVVRTVVSVVVSLTLGGCAMSVAEARQNAAAGSQAASQNAQQLTVPLSDPSRPATLKLDLMWGGVTIRGTSRKDVLIDARPSDERAGGRGRGRVYVDGGGGIFVIGRGGRGGGNADTTGLRRLTQSGGFTLEENNNQITVSSGSSTRGVDFTIDVPTRTNLKLSTLNNGPIVVENIDGEIEVNNMNESVTLTSVSGSVVANAHNGKLTVVMARVAPDKPMAFTTFNGPIDVTLPQSVKANLKLRSDHGEIFTDFDVQVRPASAAPSPSVRGPDGRIQIDVNQSIQGTVNGGGPEFELRSFNGNIYVRKAK